MPIGTVKSRLSRAKQILRDSLHTTYEELKGTQCQELFVDPDDALVSLRMHQELREALQCARRSESRILRIVVRR